MSKPELWCSPAESAMLQAPQHLRHPCPTDAKVAGQCRPALEHAAIEKRLIISGELQRIAAFLWSWPLPESR